MSNYLPLAVRKILLETNWNEKEIDVFSALLENGPLSLNEISDLTTLPVSTLQYVLKKLLTKKVIKRQKLNLQPLYLANDVDCLRKWVKGYIKQFDHYQSTVSRFIEQYDYDKGMAAPKINYFSGIEGIKKSYKYLLDNAIGREFINYFFIVDDLNNSLRTFFDTDFVPNRIKSGFRYRSIAQNTGFARYYKSKDASESRDLTLLQGTIGQIENSEINVIDDYFHYMHFNGTSGYAMIIQDESLARTQKDFILALA